MSDLGNKDVMSSNIRRYLYETGKTSKMVCKDLGISESTFSGWYSGKNYPRVDKIEMLANYFGIKKSDLVERHDPPEPRAKNNELKMHVVEFQKEALQETLAEATSLFRQLDIYDQIRIIERMKVMLENKQTNGSNLKRAP